MEITFTNELLYLIIGILIGIILGVNLSGLYRRIFKKQSKVESQLRTENKELKQRLAKKDKYIAEAIKSVEVKEERKK